MPSGRGCHSVVRSGHPRDVEEKPKAILSDATDCLPIRAAMAARGESKPPIIRPFERRRPRLQANGGTRLECEAGM